MPKKATTKKAATKKPVKKKVVKTIKVDVDKCNGCRACEMICSAFHAAPKYSSNNPARSRIRVIREPLSDIYVPVYAGEYTAAVKAAWKTGGKAAATSLDVHITDGRYIGYDPKLRLLTEAGRPIGQGRGLPSVGLGGTEVAAHVAEGALLHQGLLGLLKELIVVALHGLGGLQHRRGKIEEDGGRLRVAVQDLLDGGRLTRSGRSGAKISVRPFCYPCFLSVDKPWPLPCRRTVRQTWRAMKAGKHL